MDDLKQNERHNAVWFLLMYSIIYDRVDPIRWHSNQGLVIATTYS